jgi:hypothetical protein
MSFVLFFKHISFKSPSPSFHTGLVLVQQVLRLSDGAYSPHSHSSVKQQHIFPLSFDVFCPPFSLSLDRLHHSSSSRSCLSSLSFHGCHSNKVEKDTNVYIKLGKALKAGEQKVHTLPTCDLNSLCPSFLAFVLQLLSHRCICPCAFIIFFFLNV